MIALDFATSIILTSNCAVPAVNRRFFNLTFAALMRTEAVVSVPIVMVGRAVPLPSPMMEIPATSASMAFAAAIVSACPGATRIVSLAEHLLIAASIVAHADDHDLPDIPVALTALST